MKKWTLQSIAALLLAFVISFSSCSKEGPVGPEGPAGPTGATGGTGAQGPAGTANVIYSDWEDVVFDPIKDTADNGTVDTIAWVSEIPAPRLDETILSTGEIKVYVNVSTADDPVVYPLPLFDYYALSGVFNINLYYYLNTISLYSTEDASTFTYNGGTYFQFRYVLIPGGVSARKANASVNWNDYNAVKKYLNLKD